MLTLVPGMPLREVNAFIAEHHRHHGEERGCYFNIAVAFGDNVIGVAVVGRPKARETQAEGYTAEVTRLAVDPAWVDAIDFGLAAGAWVRGRELGLRGLAHATYVLRRSAGICSMLYGAAWRAWREMGGRRLVTYTLPEEGGASLRGAGWRCLGARGGGSWSRENRPRVDTHPTQIKLGWEVRDDVSH